MGHALDQIINLLLTAAYAKLAYLFEISKISIQKSHGGWLILERIEFLKTIFGSDYSIVLLQMNNIFLLFLPILKLTILLGQSLCFMELWNSVFTLEIFSDEVYFLFRGGIFVRFSSSLLRSCVKIIQFWLVLI